MSRYILSPFAQQDLVAIRDRCLEEAGSPAARRILVAFIEAFRMLARAPAIGHKREDLAEDRPVFFWPVRDYLIVYRRRRKLIEIVTVVHGARDIASVLRRFDS